MFRRGQLDRARIVGQRVVDLGEAEVQLRIEPEVVQTGGDGEAAFSGVDRLGDDLGQ